MDFIEGIVQRNVEGKMLIEFCLEKEICVHLAHIVKHSLRERKKRK